MLVTLVQIVQTLVSVNIFQIFLIQIFKITINDSSNDSYKIYSLDYMSFLFNRAIFV